MATIKKIIPLNRVEGDLEIHLELDRDHVVKAAKSVGTMYRGIENLMTGRGPLDSLVITPRICGICTTAHLNMPDVTRPRYADHPLYAEAMARYQPLKGPSTVQTLQETKKLIEIIAILGGQWPHSSFMVPGGVVSVPSGSDIAQCRHILSSFRKWYEKRVLGCTLDRWHAVGTCDQLQDWLAEAVAHRDSELGFFIRFCLSAGLDGLGRGHDRFISAGGPDLPKPGGDIIPLFPAGIFTPAGTAPLDLEKITEDVTCSFFKKTPGHPFDSRTIADPYTDDERKYSWAKAPRYDGQPAETGPLADMLMADKPLFVSWVRSNGASVFIRELARMVRPAMILPAVEQCVAGMAHVDAQFYTDTLKPLSARSYGVVTAPRGILGHWVVIKDGKIANYQVITPTAWNGSPRDRHGIRGPWEEAITGTAVRDPDDPVEVEQVVRSFDPCLVCTVHAIMLS
ncbi:MAG: nickel-dependent hydrogenase large subunit [Desulfosarcina sp.]|nr:nickel-dependent hydrogenase large subunit [Desulfosarcina sp.]MBC2767169.1 nickel-dependent hydrogenase large subunit [Desulfosarcina sp.]